jgi:integrase
MSKEKLPRGIRRRGRKLVAYLTHPGSKFELRSVGHMGPKAAAQQREVWMREIAEGKYLKPKKRTDLVQFADICDKAVTYYKTYKRAWDAIEGRCRVFRTWWPGRTAESILDPDINAKLLAKVTSGDWTETTSNEYRGSLIRVFALAIKRKELVDNPALAAERYKLENERLEELSTVQEAALRAAIQKKYPTKMPEFDLSLHLGCRRSNLYGISNKKRKYMPPLQWADVNLDFRVVHFVRSKSGKKYSVPINDTALGAFQILKARGDGTGAVIRKPSGIILQSSRRWFENCLEEAKIENFRWHDLRHTFATRLREAGVHIEDIGYLLGHGNKSITARYAHPPMKLLRAAVATLDQKLTETEQGTVLRFKSVSA